MRSRAAVKPAFTLIEILVVVAIIALLIAILLPSLSRSRDQARMISCQSNMRQLALAFNTYSVDNKGRLPGARGDMHADWLGGSNPQNGAAMGKQPEDGTIYKKYMGSQKQAYVCPADLSANESLSDTTEAGRYSYTMNLLLAGAKLETLAGGHYRLSSNLMDLKNFDEKEHRENMRPFDNAPMLIEEDPDYYLSQVNDSGWCNYDGITNRHLRGGNDAGMGSIGYHDGHVARARLLPESDQPRIRAGQRPFRARSHCIRTTGGKWVSGILWSNNSMYGFLDSADANVDAGVQHN